MAKPYAALERSLFGGTFQAIRTSLVSELDDSRRVLVLGEGDGRFVAALVARNRDARVVVVDGSAEMLRRAAVRCAGAAHRVEFVHANAVNWLASSAPTPRFDAVVTTFFLDCLTSQEMSELLVGVEKYVAPKARWLWADLVLAEQGWRRAFAVAVLRVLYSLFRLTTDITARRLTDPRPYFEAHGWTTERVARGLAGILEARLLVKN